MKGLIIKDLLLTRSYLKNLLFLMVAFALIGISTGNVIAFYIPFIAIMICMSTFSYDEYNKWNSYLLTMPIKKKNVVKAKYLFTILIVFFATILGIILSIFISLVKDTFVLSNFLNTVGISSFYGIIGLFIFVSLIYPLLYKFGSEKGRIYVMGLIAFIVMIMLVISSLSNSIGIHIPDSFISFIKNNIIYLSAIMTVVLYFISYFISVRIYSKKEF